MQIQVLKTELNYLILLKFIKHDFNEFSILPADVSAT